MEDLKNAFNGMLASFKDKGATMILVVFGALLLLSVSVFKIKLWKPKRTPRRRTRVITRYRNRYRRRR